MPSFEIRKTNNKGNGVYSLVHFDANQVILTFKGKVLDKKNVYELPDNKSEVLLQIAPEHYLDLNGDSSFYLNHSCNPNSSIKIISKTAFLISTRAILPDEELCFDYSITSTETPEEWKMSCACGQWNCRKVISGFNTLSDKEKEQYLKQGIVPKYVK